jgi:hypothetical protein
VFSQAGAVVGLSVALETARSGGTLEIQVSKNGVGTGFTATIDGTDTQFAYATQAASEDTFAAGDRMTVTMTGSTFAPTAGNSLSVDVLVQAT